jgi:hypothetical protein
MSSPSGFQNVVNLTPAPAVAGDQASTNPRASVNAGPGGLVAGASGVNVGLFAWIASDNITVNNFGSPSAGAPRGFVHRNQQALIENYLQISSMQIPQGFPVTLDEAGDFWAVNNGPSTSNINDQIYARYSDGAIFCASAPSGASATGSLGSTNTAAIGSTSTGTATGTSLVLTSLTGYVSIGDTVAGTGVPAGTTIVSQSSGTTGAAGTYVTSQATTASSATITTYGTVLDVSATTGYIAVGDTVSGGSGFPVGATITAQISGTANGAGLYRMSAPATAYVASATGVTTFGVTLDVTAVASGALAVGDPVSGTGVPANAVIASQLTGTVGSTGIYTIGTAASAYAASTTLTVVAGVATSWKAKSVAAVGELVKISTWG